MITDDLISYLIKPETNVNISVSAGDFAYDTNEVQAAVIYAGKKPTEYFTDSPIRGRITAFINEVVRIKLRGKDYDRLLNKADEIKSALLNLNCQNNGMYLQYGRLEYLEPDDDGRFQTALNFKCKTRKTYVN